MNDKDKKREPWTGSYADGTPITESGLKKILEDHEKWLESLKEFQKLRGIADKELYDYETLEDLEEWMKAEGKEGKRTKLVKANLKEAKLMFVNLEGAMLWTANLEGADLWTANLQGAHLDKADLKGADLRGADLERADLRGADLERAKLMEANLKGAHLWTANLEGADLDKANLEGTIFHSAIVNSKTYIWKVYFDKDTDFTGVGLDNSRIDPRLKASLKTIIRTKQWEEWYTKNPWYKRTPVCLFWKMSDYGSSTGRIIYWFFGLAYLFGLLYFYLEWSTDFHLFNELKVTEVLTYTNITDTNSPVIKSVMNFDENLEIIKEPILFDKHWLYTFTRSMYFSVVTMTTLGFGDMHAKADSIAGHIILSIHVITGYVLLGALITRLGILFTQEGPAYPIPKAKYGLEKYHGQAPFTSFLILYLFIMSLILIAQKL